VLTGDFNINDDKYNYDKVIKRGYKSAYFEIHGKEPEITFPTGI